MSADLDTPPDGRLAVVIPCYRQAHFLPDALESLRNQRRRPDRIVVVDDGSPDDVVAAVAPYRDVDLIRQDNRGLSGARNRGLAEVDAEFVLFLDSDDRLLPGALASLEAALLAHPDAGFAWGFNEPVDSSWSPMSWGPTSFEGEPTYARLLEGNCVGAPLGVLFRTAHVAAAGGFDESLDAAEDYEIFLRLAREHPYLCVHEIVAQYRHHGHNMSSNHELMYRAHVKVLEMQDPWVAGDPVLEAARRRGVQEAQRHYVSPARLERLKAAVRGRRPFTALRETADLLAADPRSLFRSLAIWLGI